MGRNLAIIVTILVFTNVVCKDPHGVSRTVLPICQCENTCSTVNATVPVIFPSKLDNYTDIEISNFNTIENVTISCPTGEVEVILKPEDYFVFSTGQLLHLTTNKAFRVDQFCIEPDILDPIPWKLHLCMPQPQIPMCCSHLSGCPVPKIPVWSGTSRILKSGIDISNPCTGRPTFQSDSITGPLTYLMQEPYASILAMDLTNGTNITYFDYRSQQEYCLSEIEESAEQYQVFYCLPDFQNNYDNLCVNGSCIHKCCPKGTVQSPAVDFCQESHVDLLWRPDLVSHRNFARAVDFPWNMSINDNPLECKRGKYMVLATDASYRFVILDNGSLYTPLDESLTPPSHYCVDNVLTENGYVEEFALLCFPDDPPHIGKCVQIKNYVIPALLMVSCVFLAITLFVYAFIPELHAKLHGKSLLSHVSALLSAYFFLSLLRVASDKLSMTLCRSFALVTQMSFLAAFFWLNVMCFDIWWTLRSMRPVIEANDSTRRRFIYYSWYAWGLPLTIGSITLTMEFLPPETTSGLVLPGFGVSSCWFQSDIGKWIYLYSFILILTMANIFFFICVTVILIQAQRANDSILRTPNLHHQERVWIYLKLFVVMGVTWVCEVISFQQKSCEYWFITDIINSLQGLFIFLIFICKKSVFHKLPLKRKTAKGLKKRVATSQGTSSYGSTSLSTQQTSLESSSRKLSSNLSYHLSKLARDASSRTK